MESDMVGERLGEDAKALMDQLTKQDPSKNVVVLAIVLEPLVAGLLRGKKFLLVLDNVWDAQIWDDLLRNPLQGGAAGSRVLVTTRNAGIARQMKAALVHEMKLLTPEDG
ncbi:NB-ARC domain [Musa troglodytarum]|uniref:NB-ARC domain n=1 Tax=Musa troglodytarum TaxID=320322 RepID=A0A9E7EGK9_9LILI|nr:NB-ARC domain [Musa troglodytarum]